MNLLIPTGFFPFFFIGFMFGCLPDGSLKHDSTTVPEPLNDGWEISTPEAEHVNPAGLEAAHDLLLHTDDAFQNALALLVSRNDKLIFETYTRRIEDRDRLHHMQSETKSITSLVFGIVRGAGFFENLNDNLQDLWPEAVAEHADKREITLRRLLTMRSGIAFDNDDFSVEMYVNGPSNPVDYILSKPMYAEPGELFYYRDADPHLISALIGRVTGRSVAEWAMRELFSPIGIDEFFWGKDSASNSMGAHGLYLKPRDRLKIGRLMLHEGVYDDETVVPYDWMTAATASQTEPDNGLEYGYYWWRVPEMNALTTWGRGGNFIFIVPEKQLVLVLVSMPDTDDEAVGTLLWDFLPLAKTVVNACEDV